MKYIILTFLLAFVFCNKNVLAQKKQAVDYVNPLIGTPAAGKGGTMPSVGPPYAMTNFTAQTRANKMKAMPYVYEDTTIRGVIATHQPTVWMGDYGYVSIMPQVGKLAVQPQQRQMKFTHRDEVSTAAYYSVKMNNQQGASIKAEVAATARCGIMKFTYPASAQSHLIIHGINVNPEEDDKQNRSNKRSKLRGYVYIDKVNNQISGYNPDRTAYNLGPELPNFKGYFIIRFDKAIIDYGTWSEDTISKGSVSQYGKNIGGYISFATKKNEVVTVKIATSFISLKQAKQNLDNEIPEWDFDRVVQDTRSKWQKNLERIKIDGVTDDQKAIFYTAMYHTMLFPREFSEYGKYYSAFDDKIHKGVSYNDYSLWDTFRALHPLLIFTQPGRVNDMITSMLQMYKEGGWLPMWPNPAETNIMIGTHADAVIADAYVKSFRGYDVNLAYSAMRKNAMIPPDSDTGRLGGDRDEWLGFEGRIGLTYYHNLGYVPSDKAKESVSRTLEYALDDYCIAQVAKSLGKRNDYDELIKWSENYKNLYNKETGFMTPRKRDGQWGGDMKFSFTEGSPWTYLFCVMQDVPGMIKMMGGNEKFAAKLDQNFIEGHYSHNNEPGHHYVYLYNYCGQPWKTQELVRQQTRNNYFNRPQGINGNDDCGQMSAWYIFSVMGFYPVTPASGIYAIGAPQFPKVIITINIDPQPKTLEIIANNISEANKYVQSVTFNGKVLSDFFISHNELIKGGKLVFLMTDKPTGKNGN
ncbi:GH92 family glycosyl hydrolase [Mucilaginibacter sabulilitoris]|uniref:GH92 family glycosyl hydrolase n=1 Tax=Mucilaginibacter sabulilitoris TaxID=1173583 RepID=A0ABZ0TQU6_9SPHI|nr:GH92 family glycosyl hydrolase [Mucilaginibacter sabulilitoris]WPU95501.1 GH92 family glycosyl hydrolase [Mucilaginibacter sabulilitoris]